MEVFIPALGNRQFFYTNLINRVYSLKALNSAKHIFSAWHFPMQIPHQLKRVDVDAGLWLCFKPCWLFSRLTAKLTAGK